MQQAVEEFEKDDAGDAEPDEPFRVFKVDQDAVVFQAHPNSIPTGQ